MSTSFHLDVWCSNPGMGFGLFADFGLLETESTLVAGVLLFVFEYGKAFCTLHDIAFGG